MESNAQVLEAVYPGFCRSGFGVMLYCLKNLLVSLRVTWPLLLIFLLLSSFALYAQRTIHSHWLSLSIICAAALLNIFVVCVAVRCLHERFSGRSMSMPNILRETVSPYLRVLLLLLTYFAILEVYYGFDNLARYFFAVSDFRTQQWAKLLVMSVLMAAALVFMLANVMLVMSFAAALVEKQRYVFSMWRSNQLVQKRWLMALLVLCLLVAIVVLAFFPDLLLVVRRMSFEFAWLTLAVTVIVVLPFWMSWYLLVYNDMKLSLEVSK